MSPVFSYRARDNKSEKIEGSLEAENSLQVVKQLKEKGYYITHIEEKKAKKKYRKYRQIKKRVGLKDIVMFSQQFSVLINAGINLIESIEVLKYQTEKLELKKVLASAQKRIEAGASLHNALSEHSAGFPRLYCQMIKTGETGGILGEVLDSLVFHYKRQYEINQKIKSALYYPIAVFAVALIVVVFLITRVVPQFVSTFSSFDLPLPLPTKMLILLSSITCSYWWVIVITILLLILLITFCRKRSTNDFILDSILLKIPVLGNMYKKIILSRFSSTLSLLLNSGIDLLSALIIVEDVIGNEVYKRILIDARGQVKEGVLLSTPLSKAREFPRLIVQMIKVGEEVGSLNDMLKNISDFYDQEVSASIESSLSLIEPFMIIFLALVVGFIVISIALPMFDMVYLF